MVQPEISIQSVLVTAGLLGLYFLGSRSLLRILGIESRTDEEIALAVPLLMLSAGILFFAAEATEFLSSSLTDRSIRPSLSFVQGALLTIPLIPIIRWRLLGGRLLPDRFEMAWVYLPVIAVGVMVVGVWNAYATDLYWFTDTTKELVWSNATDLGESVTPPTIPWAEKYAGYHAARAAVVGLGGNQPFLPDFSWSFLAAVGLLYSSYALGRNIGFGAVSGAVPVALLLLGGDSYRFATISGPRAVAAACMLAGFAVLCRAVRKEDRKQAVFAGALIAASAMTHIQYVMIAVSILVPSVLLAFVIFRWTKSTRIILAGAIACGAVTILALPQSIAMIAPETVQDRAVERAPQERKGRQGPDVAPQSPHEEWVWPPRFEVSGGTEILYSSQWLHILSPRSLVTGVWGERSSLWLSLAGAVAAWFLRRRLNPVGLVLLVATVLAPLVILFNPLVFPAWSAIFAPSRSQYIAFEFAYLALAACLAATLWYPRRFVVLALAGCVATFPIVRSTFEWHKDTSQLERDLAEPFYVEVQEVAWHTRYGDILLVPRRLDVPMNILFERYVTVPFYLSLDDNPLDVPDVFAPQKELLTVLDELQRYPGRIVLLLDEKVPPDSAARQLIARGLIQPSVPPLGEEGVYYLELKADIPEGLRKP